MYYAVSNIVVTIGSKSYNSLGNILSQHDTYIDSIRCDVRLTAHDIILAHMGCTDASDNNNNAVRILIPLALYSLAMLKEKNIICVYRCTNVSKKK